MTFGSLFDVLQMERVKNPSADFTKALCDYGKARILKTISRNSDVMGIYGNFVSTASDLAEYVFPFQKYFKQPLGIDIYVDEHYIGVHFWLFPPDKKKLVRFFKCDPYKMKKETRSEVCKKIAKKAGINKAIFQWEAFAAGRMQGFIKKSFYFVKFHIQEYWFKAEGYLDLAEVINAIDGADEEDYLAFFGDDYFEGGKYGVYK